MSKPINSIGTQVFVDGERICRSTSASLLPTGLTVKAHYVPDVHTALLGKIKRREICRVMVRLFNGETWEAVGPIQGKVTAEYGSVVMLGFYVSAGVNVTPGEVVEICLPA